MTTAKRPPAEPDLETEIASLKQTVAELTAALADKADRIGPDPNNTNFTQRAAARRAHVAQYGEPERRQLANKVQGPPVVHQ